MGSIPTRWLVSRRLFTLTALGALLVVLVPTVVITRAAQASGPAITLSPTSGAAGVTVRVTGSGFRHKEAVKVTFDATAVASATTSTSGSFSASFAVPQTAQAGSHTVTATGVKSEVAKASFQVVSSGAATSWPQFGFAAQGGRFNSTETTLSTSNVAQLTQDWSTALGGSISSFAVVNGVVYADDGTGVHALNAATGAQLWFASTMGGGSTVSSYTSPAVDNGIVYVGGGDNSVYALDATTGATRWTFATGSNILSSPTVANGVVYVTARTGVAYALDGATGAVIWSYLTNASDLINETPAVANGVVYFVTQRGVAYALNASTGALLWQVTVGDDGQTVNAPVVDNGVVYMVTGAAYPSTQGEVIALDAATGATKWTAFTAFYNMDGLALANGTLYASVVSGGVYAFDEATGALKWQDAVTIGSSAPAAANGVVYVGAGVSYLYALDATTGATLATVGNCGTQPYTSPVVAQGVVYTGCASTLGAFHLPGATP